MCLWDDCLELEAYTKSNTAHDIYNLNREVLETVMSGETSDMENKVVQVGYVLGSNCSISGYCAKIRSLSCTEYRCTFSHDC